MQTWENRGKINSNGRICATPWDYALSILYWPGLILLNLASLAVMAGIGFMIYDAIFVDHTADNALIEEGDQCVIAAVNAGSMQAFDACKRRYPWVTLDVARLHP